MNPATEAYIAAADEIRDAITDLKEAGLRNKSHRRLVIEQMGQNTKIGSAAFAALSDRDAEGLHGLWGWPDCGCTACGCSEPATGTDDSGVAVCEACSDYTVDDDGEVHCSQCEDTEVISDSWGRSLTRIKPPEEPETDPLGKWACYWDTSGNEAHVVARYSTRETAEQAVAAKDWPRPGDSTAYLCGFVIRELEDGKWVRPEEEAGGKQ
jgi:hypothetical protein